MIPQTTSAILATALFLLPGFIGQRYAEQTYSLRSEDSGLRGFALTLYYSLLSYIALVTITVLAGGDRGTFETWISGTRQPRDYLLVTLGLITISIALAEISRRWRTSDTLRHRLLTRLKIDERHTVVSGWEWFFNTGTRCLVIATLKDDTQIAGYYGTQSYSGYTQDTPDLFLQQRWTLNQDGWLEAPANGTLGVYIRADEIKTVDFYELQPTTENVHDAEGEE